MADTPTDVAFALARVCTGSLMGIGEQLLATPWLQEPGRVAFDLELERGRTARIVVSVSDG